MSNHIEQAHQPANVSVNTRLLDALRLTVRPLIRLGDFVGNVDKGGASHLGEFDRCAIVLEVRNAIEVAEKLLGQAPATGLSPAADGRLKFRVLGAHPDATFFDLEVEACDGQSAFGAAAVLLHEADEDGDAEFYAAIPAGTDVTQPGEGVVTLGTVLDPEQADVFGLDLIQNVVADVLQRAVEYGFTPDEITVADAVTESANLLSIELSDAEIVLASQRVLDVLGNED